MPNIEFIGLKLPSNNPLIQMQMLEGKLTKQQAAGIRAMDLILVGYVRIEATTSFSVTPKTSDNLITGSYKWCRENFYTTQVSDVDWARLKRLPECDIWRNLDDPRDRKRLPDYPSEKLLSIIKLDRFGVMCDKLGPGAAPAIRLLRKARRSTWTPGIISEYAWKRDVEKVLEISR